MQVCAPRPVSAAAPRAAALSIVALFGWIAGGCDEGYPPSDRTYQPISGSASSLPGPVEAPSPAPLVAAPSKASPGKLVEVAPTAVAPSGRPRFALVMANGAYNGAVKALPEAHADAWRMADALAASGFSVLVLEDATQQQMSLALVALVERARSTGGVEAALVYYAGHGAKVPTDDTVASVLVPTDAKGSTEAQLAATSIPLAWVQEKLVASGAEVLIAVIDACRDNPFLAGWVASTQGQSRALSGLGGVQALRGGCRRHPRRGLVSA